MRFISLALATVALAAASAAHAEQPLVIKPLAERKVAQLPDGELFWRIETFPTRDEAEAAAGKWSMVVEAAGKIWVFSLGPASVSAKDGSKLTEVGPIPRFTAPKYLLRINEASGAPGSVTPVHTHPGSEAFLVLAGEQTIRMPHGVMKIKAGQTEPGHGAGMPMQISSSGTADLHALVMFVVDATKPFAPPAQFP